MRGLLVSLAIWSVVVLAIVLVWPGQSQTPGCASAVTASADCLIQVKAMNDRIWWTSTLPILVVVASGYLVIAALALGGRRHLPRR